MSDIFHEVDEDVRRSKTEDLWRRYQTPVYVVAFLIGLDMLQVEATTTGKAHEVTLNKPWHALEQTPAQTPCCYVSNAHRPRGFVGAGILESN